MNLLGQLKNSLEEEINKLSKQIIEEKKVRDTAPSAMESHSDTTRSQSEKLIIALEAQLRELKQNLLEIPNKNIHSKNSLKLWNTANIKLDGKNIKIILVPEGLGGKRLDDIQTLATSSPLGMVLKDKKSGYKFTFNEKVSEITEIIE